MIAAAAIGACDGEGPGGAGGQGAAATSTTSASASATSNATSTTNATSTANATSSANTSASATATSSGTGARVDDDQDGIDDAVEALLAETYFPFLSVDPADGCPRAGVLFRARPHPDDATKVHLLFDVLYERDCGLTGHVGDNEAFGVTIDPAVPPPEGVLSIVAIGHQATLCEAVSRCGRCPGLDPCDVQDGRPVVYASKDKHASYAVKSRCGFLSCFDSCTLAPTAPALPFVNAGEPGHPLVTDLTAQGFIRDDLGWTEAALFGFDPWAPDVDFGGAGNVADDLVDGAFVGPACDP